MEYHGSNDSSDVTCLSTIKARCHGHPIIHQPLSCKKNTHFHPNFLCSEFSKLGCFLKRSTAILSLKTLVSHPRLQEIWSKVKIHANFLRFDLLCTQQESLPQPTKCTIYAHKSLSRQVKVQISVCFCNGHQYENQYFSNIGTFYQYMKN